MVIKNVKLSFYVVGYWSLVIGQNFPFTIRFRCKIWQFVLNSLVYYFSFSKDSKYGQISNHIGPLPIGLVWFLHQKIRGKTKRRHNSLKWELIWRYITDIKLWGGAKSFCQLNLIWLSWLFLNVKTWEGMRWLPLLTVQPIL